MAIIQNIVVDSTIDAPHHIFSWLTDVKKLSVAFKRIYSTFAVNVISEQISDFTGIEKQKLNADNGYVRQVFLLGDDTPQVYARVAVPLNIYHRNEDVFRNLGSKPIGETLLYCNPNITRTEFEYSSINVAELPFYKSPDTLDSPFKRNQLLETRLWSRTSCFMDNNEMYLSITETFFPTIIPHNQIQLLAPPKVIAKNGTLEFDEDSCCVIARFTGFMTSEEFRNFLNEGLEFCIQHKRLGRPVCWLADTQNHSIQSKEDTDWVAHDWNARALAAGIKHIAFVLPENMFGELSVQNYLEETEQTAEDQMITKTFNNIEKAKRWFKTTMKNTAKKPKETTYYKSA